MLTALWFACATPAPAPAPIAAVDAAPGPGSGWLTPRIADPAPLRLGMSLPEAEASWEVSTRAVGPIRALSGLILTGPPGKSKAILTVDDAEKVTSINFVLDAVECPVARERVAAQYGAPTGTDVIERWQDVATEVGFRTRPDGGCTIGWKLRKVE